MKWQKSVKSYLFTAILLVQIFMLLPLGALADQVATVNTGSLKLRSRKSQDAIVIADLQRGDKVTVLDESGDWLKVAYDNFTGYIMKEYVKVSGSSSASSNASSEKDTRTPGTLRLGDRGSEVKDLQKSLKSAGYLKGEADGVFGEDTQSALKSFQRANGLKADGIAGTGTFSALGKKGGESKPSAGVSTISEIGSTPGTSKVGDCGTYVKKLQQALALNDHYQGKIDGVFGSGTEEAVKEFQRKHGMNQDGIAGTATITLLFGEKPSDTSSTLQEKATEATKGETETNSAQKGDAGNGISSIGDIGTVPGTSKAGDSGTYVKKLQQALALKGFYSGNADGVFGSGTESAVKAFQKKHGMSQDGVAGTTTITVLFGEKPSDTSATVANSSNSSNSNSSESADEKKYTTETLNWFNGGNTAIPKGARFTIKDVATGKTFEAKRWSGGNHMDVEPTSSEEAQKMKEIYGGSWSWRRRAILIKYNGHVIRFPITI